MNLRELNLKLTKQSLREQIPRDILIIQTIHTIDELTKIINKITTNLRERYGYYAHKASREEDITKFLNSISKEAKEDMGIDMNSSDINSMKEIAEEVKQLIRLEESQEKYLESLTNEICPNMAKIATPLIAARLIDLAGSLKHLAELPSSTIQVLGAEKALFRHLKTGAKAPKFGVIFLHPQILNTKDNRGKTARQLASQISKSAKIDYFKEGGKIRQP